MVDENDFYKLHLETKAFSGLKPSNDSEQQ